MGRNKKPVELKKLEGTFRADRDAGQQKTELAVRAAPGVILPPGTKLSCPKSITSKYVRGFWKRLTANLIALRILSYSDLPMLENMMLTLQRLREAQDELAACPVSEPGLQKRYEMLSHTVIKLTASFNDMAVKFYISPAARNKLKLETLTGEKLLQEVRRGAGAVGAVLDMRRSSNE